MQLQKGPGQHKNRSLLCLGVCYILKFASQAKDTILVPDAPKPSGIIEGSDYKSIPSYLAFVSTGARGGCPGLLPQGH